MPPWPRASPPRRRDWAAWIRWSIPPASSSSGRWKEITTAEWDRILDVNLRGTFLVMREAMPHLKASGRGRVVNISSDAGKTGFALLGAYCASKFAVVGLTQAVAVEVAPHGVRVNAVCPGTIAETGMGRVVIEQKIELGYGQSPEEVVRARRRVLPAPARRHRRRRGRRDHVPDLGELGLDHRQIDQCRRRLAGGVRQLIPLPHFEAGEGTHREAMGGEGFSSTVTRATLTRPPRCATAATLSRFKAR